MLRRRAESKGLETVRDRGRRPLLSDFIRDTFPRDWLATVYPELVDKLTGHTMVKVDGVLFMGSSASSVWPYLLAAAVLYDDADEALNELFNAKETAVIARRRTVPNQRSWYTYASETAANDDFIQLRRAIA